MRSSSPKQRWGSDIKNCQGRSLRAKHGSQTLYSKDCKSHLLSPQLTTIIADLVTISIPTKKGPDSFMYIVSNILMVLWYLNSHPFMLRKNKIRSVKWNSEQLFEKEIMGWGGRWRSQQNVTRSPVDLCRGHRHYARDFLRSAWLPLVLSQQEGSTIYGAVLERHR